MRLNEAARRRLVALARGRGEPGLFLLEGVKSIHDALATGHVVEVWRREDLVADIAIPFDQACADAGVPLGLARAADFGRLGDVKSPQGVVAVVRDVRREPDDVFARPGWILWLDGLQDPGNVGAALRVAAAFGAAGLLVSDDGAHPLGSKALRASAGLALSLPFARGRPAALAGAVRLDGRRPYLLDANGEDVFVAARSISTPGVLIVGSEGRGASEAARELDATVLAIPIAPGVESLNAAVALGIAFAVLARKSPA